MYLLKSKITDSYIYIYKKKIINSKIILLHLMYFNAKFYENIHNLGFIILFYYIITILF